MIQRNVILKFIISAGFIYAFFILIAFAGGEKYYQSKFSSMNESLISKVLKIDSVEFRQNDKADKKIFDTKVLIINKQSVLNAKRSLIKAGKTSAPITVNWITFHSLRFAYLPTIIVLSLILATPFVTYRRRIWCMILGFTIINLFLIFKLYLWILQNSSIFESMSIFWQKSINFFVHTMVEDMPMRIIIPVFIWLLVSFRVSDYRGFVASLEPKK